MREGLNNYGIALFTRVLGKSAEEAKRICDAAFAEFGSSVHTYNAQ